MQQAPLCTHRDASFMLRVRQFSRLSARLRAGQLKHIRAQAERNQSSAAALAEQDQEPAAPTFVPRGPGVTDGKWDQQDEAAVNTALRDAEKVVKKRSSAQPGMIPLQPHMGWPLICLLTFVYQAFHSATINVHTVSKAYLLVIPSCTFPLLESRAISAQGLRLG